MKKIRILVLILVLLCLCGCSFKKESVELFTEKEALKYVEVNYGKAELLNTEKPSNESVKYTFSDNEYKFQYTLTSEIEEVSFPVTFYHTRELSTFDETYYDYILNNLSGEISRIQSEYGVRIVKREKVYLKNVYAYDKNLYDLYKDNDDIEIMRKASKELIKAIKKIDNRSFYKGYSIYLYSTLKEDDMGDKKILDKVTIN